jgi:hypothetical protein
MHFQGPVKAHDGWEVKRERRERGQLALVLSNPCSNDLRPTVPYPF